MPTQVTKVSLGDRQAIDISDLGIGYRNIPIWHGSESAGIGINRIDLHAHIATEACSLVRSDGPRN